MAYAYTIQAYILANLCLENCHNILRIVGQLAISFHKPVACGMVVQ